MSELEDKLSDWEAYRMAAKKEDLKPTLNTVKIDKEKASIVPLGDTHIGSRYFDESLLKENLEWCVENDARIILMGDMIETATRDSVGAGVYEQDEIVDTQLEHFYHLFRPVVDEGIVLGLHPGNHEMRIYKSAGLNISKQMSKELKIPYLGWGKLHYLRVGNQRYTMYTTHGSSGARLPHTKIKGALDLANLADAEIYAMGHLHQLSHHIRNFYKPDLRAKKVSEEQKHFLLCGAYLNHWGSYGHIKNYEPVRKGSPKIKLHGDKHKIRVSL